MSDLTMSDPTMLDPALMKKRYDVDMSTVKYFFLASATTSTLLRVYVRGHIVKKFGWDDFFMVVALLAHGTYVSMSYTKFCIGIGKHMELLTPDQIRTSLMCWWMGQDFYVFGTIIAKISIGFFLHRFLVEPIHKWIVRVAVAAATCIGAVYFFVATFQCTPVSYFWNKAVSDNGSCRILTAVIALGYVYSMTFVLTDLTLTVIPLWLVWGLSISKKTKIGLMVILGMGFIASIAVCVRVAYIQTLRDPDFLYATTPMASWSACENGFTIIAGNLATLRPLYKQILHKLGPSWERTKSRTLPSLKMPTWIRTVTVETERQDREPSRNDTVMESQAQATVSEDWKPESSDQNDANMERSSMKSKRVNLSVEEAC